MSRSLTELDPRRAGRPGRPPRALAGEVDVRILDAARQVFLERGLAGSSMDEIAARAGAGKPTIYARFPGKEALFTAVVMRDVDAKIARFVSRPAMGANIEQRLASVAADILHWALVGDTVGLLRLAVAEAPRFPDLATRVSRMTRERGTEAVVRVLGEMAQSDELARVPAFTPERLPATASLFKDLIFAPMILRALHGEKLEALRADIKPHVTRGVAFFLAGCRFGGVG